MIKTGTCFRTGICFFKIHDVMGNVQESKSRPSESFIIGVVALVFLLTGYQTALFVHRAAVLKITADRDAPDTVYVYVDKHTDEPVRTEKRMSEHNARAAAVRMNIPVRKVESFRFDPNTVSVEDLCRLGFTARQASSIDNYRRKGGRFRRKSDFARSYVVSDSVYKRLESYIDIPLTDLNLADSADFDALPGIGGWFASRIVEYRTALNGYSHKEQLLEISRFDEVKYDGLKDLVTVSADNVTPYPLWTLPADSLKMHPYIRNIETARAIVLYRENNPLSEWTVEKLCVAGIILPDDAYRLSRCLLVPAS